MSKLSNVHTLHLTYINSENIILGMNDFCYIGNVRVSITRKKIKNMHIYIKPPYGEVSVTAPLRMPFTEIETFVKSKEAWIVKNIEKMQNSPIAQDPHYESGEKISIWGDIYTLEVHYSGRFSMELEESEDGALTAHLFARTDSTVDQRRAFILEWYRAELTERVEILLPKWEQYTGLHCSSWQSKNMKTRWGTCNTKTKKIWLNVMLAKYPVECLEYVILHELAHTEVPNHGSDFKAILDRFMPDWKERRKRLRSIA